MLAALHLLWDLSDPAARCTVNDLERGVHDGGLARFTGQEDLHTKIWFRDEQRYGSIMVFTSPEARDACRAWVTERVSEVSGLQPMRVESYDVIAVAEGAAGIAGLTAPAGV